MIYLVLCIVVLVIWEFVVMPWWPWDIFGNPFEEEPYDDQGEE